MTSAGVNWKRWMRIAMAAVVALLCVAIVTYGVTHKPKVVKAAPIGARLELAAGEVKVEQGGTGEQRAVSGTALLSDAKVSTGKGARALVKLPDGSSVFLRGSSVVVLGTGTVKLQEGEEWLSAPPVEREALVHQVGEVTVTAVDAGLSLKKEADGVVVYVARGMAVVSGPGGRVEVNAGEQASVKGAGAPKVEPVSFWDDWTGGMADLGVVSGAIGSGSGAIYGVDEGAPGGNASRRLELKSQTVRAVIREGLSETEVDQVFFNPGERAVEGWYWFTVPERASVTGFAVDTDGVLIEGEFIERREAAAQYGAAKSSGHEPALLEWVDARTYRARIYPVPAAGTRRVVLRYLELGPMVEGRLEYVYPMGAGEPVRVGEFSLTADLGEAGRRMQISTLADAKVEDGGQRVTMRRSGYTPRAEFQLEAVSEEKRAPLLVSRFATGGEGADYVMARYLPDLDWAKVKEPKGEVVVVVDTSAGGDEANGQLKASAAEAILRALSDEDRFALISLDVKPTVLHPAEGLAAATDKEIATALEKLAGHAPGGATDLAASFEVALGRVHGGEQPAVVYVGDGIATSGEMSGEQLVERLRRALSTSRARFFTVAVGAEADQALLGELARAGGGQSFRVDEASDVTGQALELAAAVKVPTITDFEIDLGAGLDEPFVSTGGKVSRGTEVVVLARTHADIPAKVMVRGRLGGDKIEKEYAVTKDKSVVGAFVPRLWAAEYVRRLLGASSNPEEEHGRIASLGIDYGLMTPYTSILALESEAAFYQMGIPRKKTKLRGVRLGGLDREAEERLAATLSAGPAPLSAFGCDKREDASAADVEASAASPENGAQGKRSEAQGTATAGALATKRNEKPVAQAAPAPAPDQAAPTSAAAADEPAAARKSAARAADNASEPGGRARGDDDGPANARHAGVPRSGDGRPGDALRRPAAAPERGAAGAPAKGKLRELDAAAKKELPVVSAPAVPPPPAYALATCSDVAQRPLPLRVLLWKKRLHTAQSAQELLERYVSAWRACELPDWAAERTFLKLLQEQIKDEGTATAVLSYFASRPEVQKYIGQLMLRREVSERIVAAVERVLFGSAVDWNKVDLELQGMEKADAQLAKLREYMSKAPEDPNGDIRLVKFLVETGQVEEALAHGRRLRDRGYLTLRIARQLGDVLARAGQAEEAVRTYSEIVEFDPTNVASRRLLGDIYLGHGWYEPAYRQYKTLTEASADDPLGWLRLADAAGGTGRVDEALRLERKISGAPGRPGPTDPRVWAKLLSAARLSELMDKPPEGKLEGIKRELKELQLFRGAATLVVLTWEDLGSDLQLVSQVGKEDVALGEVTDGAPAGLSASLLGPADFGKAAFVARLRSEPRDDAIALRRHDISWDGKDFQVKLSSAKLEPHKIEASL